MLQHLIASHTYIIEIISVNMLCAVIAWCSLVSVSHWLRLLSAAGNDSRIVCLDWLGLNMLVCTQESAAVTGSCKAAAQRIVRQDPQQILSSAQIYRLQLYRSKRSDLYSRWLRRQLYLTPMVIYSLFVNFITNRERFLLADHFLEFDMALYYNKYSNYQSPDSKCSQEVLQ